MAVPPEQAFEPIGRLGGETGWYFANSLWRLRGSIDLLAGGVGLRRGRRGSSELVPGATVDFWRVEAVEPGKRLTIRAEMKLPGEAWLEFEVAGDGSGSTICQTATFDARGLAGAAYWYALYPFHRYVFRGMARALADAAEARDAGVQCLEREQLVPRPLDEVFAFFADAANLEAITPPELRFHLLTPHPIKMQPGATIDYALRLRGLPIRWPSEIVTWEPGRRFVDIQRRGPYALWEHTHEFSPVDGGTLVKDHVRYRLPLGSLGALAHALVRRDLERIFDHRQTAIGRLLAPHHVAS